MNITKSLFILLPVFAIGCEQVDSVDVRTDGIHADISLVTDGNGKTDLSATLRVGGSNSNTYLDLVDGDELTAFAGAEVKKLSRNRRALGQIHYEGQFDTDREDTQFRIAFTRVGHDSAETECRGGDAPNSTATLPAPFAIQSPAETAAFSADNDDIEVSWSNSGQNDDMEYRVSGSCIKDFGDDNLNDDGRFTIDHDDFKLVNDEATFDCDVKIKITRSREGSIDSGYGEGGKVNAHQVRSVEVKLRP